MKLFSLKSAGLLLTLLLLAITFRCELNAESKSQPLIHYIKSVSATCIRTIDGDTIIVNIEGQKERVRLIGVDTPKTKQTLEETGRDFNVTRERIRQIQVKAMKKLQHPTRSKILRSFVEK